MNLSISQLLSLVSIFICGILLTIAVALSSYRNQVNQLESAATDRLQATKSRLEKTFFQDLSFTLALEAFAQNFTELDTEDPEVRDRLKREFKLFAETLESNSDDIISLQLAPDGIVTYVTNEERNKAALGHDLFTNDSRREQSLNTLRSKTQLVAGPLTLLQGGEAIIARRSIIIPNKQLFDPQRYIRQGRATSESAWLRSIPNDFWGFATALIDTQSLYKRSGLSQSDGLFNYALKGRHGLGWKGEIFWGDPVVFERSFKSVEIDLNGGSWILSAQVVNDDTYITFFSIIIFGAFITVFLTLAAFTLLRHHKLSESKRLLENQQHLLEETVKKRTTELEEAKDQALAASKLKTDFLANMSHEIRTPLNSVIGLTHMALQSQLDEKQKAMIEKANMAGEILLRVIDDILDLSKMESEKLILESIDFQLKKLVANVVELFAIQAKNKQLTITYHVDDDVEDYLSGDPTRLSQILINLINNAVKFSQKSGCIAIHTKLVNREDSNVTLQFTVKDDGIGISDEDKEKLFQAFSQADTSITRKFGGTGLGLIISKRLVEMMDGNIWLSSQESKGSTFCFTVVLEAAQFNQAGSNKTVIPSKPDATEILKGAHILVAEDNNFNQDVIELILTSNGMSLKIANNGKDALNLLKQEPFDAVLMDCQMPEMDGFTATEQIRQLNQFKNLPIIALTANTMGSDQAKAFSCGMDDFVSKPVKPEVLLQILASWIKK